MAMEEINYLWEHWKFNADQRIKAFNFFVIFSVFTNGGFFTALEKCAHPIIYVLIGLFTVVLSLVFWAIDVRSQRLIRLSIPGLKKFELILGEEGRLFHLDEPNWKSKIRFTWAFRSLFVLQLTFGIAYAAIGVTSLYPSWFGLEEQPLSAICKSNS